MHAFAEPLRVVARGSTLGRSLSEDEAERALGMILDGDVEPVQLGAFLLVLRYRTETAEELAGFVRAARARLAAGPGLSADLDWPSYADRHKQLPYFIVAALLLAQHGVRVLMHGVAGEGSATTRAGLAAFGIEGSLDEASAARALDRANFAYLPLEAMQPKLAELFGLRPLLGLRTPVHTLAREVNPAGARAQIQGVFHPDYLVLHQNTQALLGQPRGVTFKGGGGEGQRNPDKPCRLLWVEEGERREEVWPAIVYEGETWPWRQEPLESARLAALWRGDWDAPGPVAAVIGTTALCLRLLGRAETPDEAHEAAASMWRARRLDAAA